MVNGGGNQVDQRLSIARAGFVYRGGLLWNQLPDSLRTNASLENFKKGARRWVQSNVKVKPG